MGVFGKSKKAKEVNYYLPDDGGDSSVSKMSRSLKRKQKTVVAPKPEIDLATALPTTNDFRTSLLMPQLSARFSMLREQDDPTTKIGKANDDSVLFPKRASRLNLFSHNPLTDIAEVESIHTTIRPPYARVDRSYSISDGYASDDAASMMARAKPGEGNSLFGGRQKMYRVPAAGESARTLTDSQARRSGLGKHMYEDDVSKSSFQKYKAQVSETERNQSSSLDEEETDAVNSPMTAFSKNRGTTSSTTSGPSNRRTSTAATSITSESPIPRQNSHGFSKPRTSDSVNGSDESLIKRNLSSDSRKNSALRDGTSQPPVPLLNKSLSQSRSAVNLNDKYSRAGAFSPSAFRAVSPPPISNAQAIASLDLGLQDANQRVASPTRRYQTSSPSSPSPIEDEVDQVYSSIQPNDRGKATAMGLFNRPRQQFDEQQFLQRQRQMLEGRSSPFPSESRTESRVSPEVTTSVTRRVDAAIADDQDSSVSLQALNQFSNSSTSSQQTRGLRNFSSPHKTEIGGYRSRNPSSLSSGPGAVDVQARVESLIRRQNAELAALEVERSVVTESFGGRKISESSEGLDRPSRGTFFNTFDVSEDETERSPQRESRPRMAPSDIHPALRDGTHDFDFGDNVSLTPRIPYRQSNGSNLSASARDSVLRPSQPKGSDSPTLGPNGLGLSGMIRSHLRHDSDKSSIYPPSPRVSTFSQREVSMASTAHTVNPPESIHSDPWEFDSTSRNQTLSQSESRTSDVTPTMSQKAQQILGHTQTHPASSKAQRILGHEAPNASTESAHIRSWHDDLAAHHRRGESTETQKEREDFDNELAERQRRIQERLKGVAEQELRSRSPVGRQERHNLPAQAFHALKQKTSMGNMGSPSKPDGQPKAMKMLGLNSREDVSMRSPAPGRIHDFDAYHERPHPSPQPHHGPPPPVDSGYRSGRRTPGEGRPPMEAGHSSNGRRTPGDGRPPMEAAYSGNGRRTPGDGRPQMDAAYSNGRRTPGDGRPVMDTGYSNGRRTPAEGRAPYADSSNEEFDRPRQRSATPNSGRPRRDRADSNAPDGPRNRNGPYRDEYGYPPNTGYGQSPSPPDMRNRRGAHAPDLHDPPSPAVSSRIHNGSRPPHPGHFDNRIPPSQSPIPPQMKLPPGSAPRPSPRPPFPPSPMSPFGAPEGPPSAPFAHPSSSSTSAMPSPIMPNHLNHDGRSTPILPSASRTTTRDRKKSITRGMISEPTFLSSTSSVPLVELPNGVPSPRPNPMASPPIPAMNPRRRGNTNDLGGNSIYGSHSAQPSPSLPMHSPLPITQEPSNHNYPHPSQFAQAAATQHSYHSDPAPPQHPSQYPHQYQEPPAKHPQAPPPRARNRLRKISSEGGNMASRARQQVFMAEMGREKQNSPRVPMFPNRSTTSLGMAARDGGMF